MKKSFLFFLVIFIFIRIGAAPQNPTVYSIGPGMVIMDDSIETRSAAAAASSNLEIPQPFAIPPSPHSQIFDRVFVDYPMTEYYGLPDISIPLCEISMHGVTIPVTLVYHAGGIKYMQYDGEVAAGWSINAAGYRITRSIYGKSDFDYTKRAKATDQPLDPLASNPRYTVRQNQWLKDEHLAKIACIPNQWGVSQYSLGQILSTNMPANAADRENWFLDGEYDQFTFNTPTTTGHFVIDDRLGFRDYWTGAGLESNDEKISIRKHNGEIIDQNGIKYTFGGNDAAIEKTKIESEDTLRETGWALTKILNTYGDEITFSYKQDIIHGKRAIANTYQNASFSPASYACFSCYGLEHMKQEESKASRLILGHGGRNGMYPDSEMRTPVIRNIMAPGMTITFNRGETNDVTGNTPSLIKSIEIRNTNSSFYKKIVFNQRKYVLSALTTDCWHYLLDSITIEDSDGNIEKKYTFDYYGKTNLPSTRPYPDQWGYYKFGGNPRINLHNEFNSEEFLSATSVFLNGTPQTHRSTYYNEYRTENTTISRGVSPEHVGKEFSLKSITYPTGGITEFEYGNNKYYCPEKRVATWGGGLRVEKITHKESLVDQSPLVTTYDYDLGAPSFPLTSDNFQSTTMALQEKTYGSEPNTIMNTKVYEETKTFSMDPTGDVPVGDFKVMYPQVTVTKQRKINDFQYLSEGKTVSTYLIPEKYTTSPFNTYASGNRLIFIDHEGYLAYDTRQPTGTYNRRNSVISVTQYAPGYEPQLLTRTVFSEDNDTVRYEKYDYYDSSRDSVWMGRTFHGVKVSQKVFWGPPLHMHDTPFDYLGYDWSNPNAIVLDHDFIYWQRKYAYYFVNTFFEFMPYKIIGGKYLPKSKTVREYDLNGQRTVSSSENYEYDSRFRLTNTTTTDSDSKAIRRTNLYPESILEHRALYDANMQNTLLESYTTYNGVETSRIKYHYQPTWIFPSYVQGSTSGSDDLRTYYEYRYAPDLSNLVEYRDIKGLYTTVLWSYNNQYPVMLIENLRYTEVEAVHPWLDILKNNPEPGYTTMQSIANSILNRYSNVRITFYTHIPGVGVSSVTDPSGRITLYEYDSFGRLYRTKFKESYDADEVILEEHNYNYRNN